MNDNSSLFKEKFITNHDLSSSAKKSGGIPTWATFKRGGYSRILRMYRFWIIRNDDTLIQHALLKRTSLLPVTARHDRNMYGFPLFGYSIKRMKSAIFNDVVVGSA